MSRSTPAPEAGADADAVTDAVLAASRMLTALSTRSIAAVDDTITVAQFRLLVVLDDRGPLKLTAIAGALGVNPSTATRMVDRLVSTERISRKANPASRRELVVDLTASGRALVRDVVRRRRALVSRIVSEMTPTARRSLVRTLWAFTAGGEPGPRAEPVWL